MDLPTAPDSAQQVRPQAIQIDGSRHWTDWVEYTTGVQPVGFTQMWDATPFFRVADDVSTAGNKMLEWSATGISRNRFGLAYDGFGDIANQEVFTNFRVRSLGGTAGPWYMGSAAVRITGTATNEGGYALWFVAGTPTSRSLALSTFTNGGYTQLATTPLSWTDDTWYSIRLRAVGTSIQARIWVKDAPEPATWMMSVTDSRWATGKPGVSNHDNGVVQWDYWEATQIGGPTLLQIVLIPTTASVAVGGTLQFNASGLMSDGSTGSVSVVYSATGGTISAAGLYTAGTTPGTYSVIATSANGPQLADTSAVTITTAPVGGSTQIVTFAEGPAGVQPAGWTETSAPANTSWTVVADATAQDGRMLRNTTTVTARHILRLDAVADSTTQQEVLVRIRLADSDGRGPGIALRHTMNGALETAYVAYFRPGLNQLEINRFLNGAWAYIAATPFTTSLNTWYWMRFRADGSTLRLRVWADGTTEPTGWNITATNTGIANGSVGAYVYENNTVDYDVFTFASGGATAPIPVAGPPPSLTQLTLTPAQTSVLSGATQQFTATGTFSDGATAPVTATYNATGGSITTGGLYTAGSTSGNYQVIATDPGSGLADTATVTIPLPPTLVSVTVTPMQASMQAGGTLQFSAVGNYTDGSTGSVSVVYSATGGTISAAGLYTAGTTPGTYSVIATSANGPQLADTSAVTITTAPVGGSTQIVTFAEGPAGVQPAGWTETSAPANTSWTVVADATAQDGRMLRNTTTVTARHILRLDAVADSTTQQEVLVRIRLADSDGRGPGIALRHTMNGALETAYVAYFRPGLNQLEINRFLNGAWAYIAATPFTTSLNTWYWMRFRADGSTLRLRVWADGTTEPTGWNITATNTGIANGSVGAYVYENNTVDYDVFTFASGGATAPIPSAGPLSSSSIPWSGAPSKVAISPLHSRLQH
ncbi:MAG: hypothetical protein WEE89_19635 [Gemmatimonadota bacterium]